MLRIGDFARLGGVQLPPLRHYQAKALLPAAQRDPRPLYRDEVASQREHLAQFLPRHHVDDVDAEAGSQHAVERRRRAPALDVSEDGRARLVSGLLLGQLGDLLPDAADADMAELVELLGHLALAAAQLRALCDHYDGEVHAAGADRKSVV